MIESDRVDKQCLGIISRGASRFHNECVSHTNTELKCWTGSTVYKSAPAVHESDWEVNGCCETGTIVTLGSELWGNVDYFGTAVEGEDGYANTRANGMTRAASVSRSPPTARSPTHSPPHGSGCQACH